MFDYTNIAALAADYSPAIVRLSAESLALFLSTNDLTRLRRWLVSGEKPDETQESVIDELVSKAYFELMEHPLLGTLFPFATTSVPDGALECDGASYLRTDYPALYAVLDGAFIIDADNFVAPDLSGRVILGAGSGSGLSVYAVNDNGGEENHTLITSELPSHTHGVTDPTHAHVESIAIPAVGAALVGVPIPSAVPGLGTTGASGTGISINGTGSDTAHENRQPYRALRMAIWAI
jgi:microcystin-dependent protein